MAFIKVRALGTRESRSWFIGLGIGFLVLGALAIFVPLVASVLTTMLFGWLLVIGGILTAVHAVQNRRWAHSGWALVSAAVEIVAGLLLVAFPLAGTATLTLVLAAFFAAEGVVRIIRAYQHRAAYGWGFLLFDGIVSLVLGGLILLGWPSTAVWALGLLLGIELVLGGSSLLVIGLGAGAPARVGARDEVG